MEFMELSDGDWELIKPFLPPRADDGEVINGMLYVLTTGCRWMDMPAKYSSYVIAWRRLKGWQEMGIWAKVPEALISRGYAMGRLSLDYVATNSTTVEAREGELIGYDGYKHRKGSKVHVAVSGESLPLSLA